MSVLLSLLRRIAGGATRASNGELRDALLGAACEAYAADDLERALALCTRLLETDSGDADAHLMRGRIALRRERWHEARTHLAAAAAAPAFGDDASLYFELAHAAERSGDLGAAVRDYAAGLRLQPEANDARLRLANALVGLGRLSEAIEAYEALLRLEPGHAGAAGNFAVVLEAMNRLDEARTLAERALQLDAELPQAVLVRAKLLRRAGKLVEAIAALESVPASADPQLAIEAHLELGRLYDTVERPDDAFEQMARAKALQRSLAPAGKGASFLHEVDTVLAFVREHDLAATLAPRAALPVDAPGFLVGFPRSGTTLLESALDAHSAIRGFEERPMVEAMLERASAFPEGYPRMLLALSDSDRAQLVAAYDAVLERELSAPRARGSVVLDKYPLNLVRVPLILAAFPGARFILAVRHPCDVCLSCIMQYFGANSAMANLLDLDSTVELYVRVMGLWRMLLERLPLQYRRVRYEDVVTDFRGEVGGVLEFLGLEWEEGVAHYHERAARRGRIDTPSYHQVAQPLYTRAAYRWLRYRRHLEPYLERLAPFAEYFDYPPL